MSEQQPVYVYDFEKAIPLDEIRESYLLPYLEAEDEFKTVSERVLEGNPYIQNGAVPTGLRDLQFSFDVSLTHVKSGNRQDFTREELEDLFKVVKKKRG